MVQKRKIRIFDTTLRDGEQSPGVSLTPNAKIELAKRLDAMGVDTIEVGFPKVSEGETEAIKKIANLGIKAELCALARANKEDIDAVKECGIEMAHIFIATSELHLKNKLKVSKEEALSRISTSVSYAKKLGLVVEFSAEDATRTQIPYLIEAYLTAKTAGADRINIPDTVGISTPDSISKLVKIIYNRVALPISIHCHNDFGLAVSNTLAAIESGASCAHVTINGVGERSGNAALEEIVGILGFLEPSNRYYTLVKTEKIYKLSNFVSQTYGMDIQPNKAIVGKNSFSHESGIHTHGIICNPLTYEPVNPKNFGRERSFIIGKHSGKHAIKMALLENNIAIDDIKLEKVLKEIKKLCDSGTVVDIYKLIQISSKY